MTLGSLDATLEVPAAREVTALLDAAARAGERRHAAWDAARFYAYAPAAAALWAATRSRPLVAAYLECVREGVACGLLQGRVGEPATLLELCLATLAPAELPRRSVEEGVALLAATFNLCEGLAAEPEWMQSWVLARRAELTSLSRLADHLVRVIEPVIGAPPASTFSKDVAVSVLDTRAVDDQFLPGELSLVAPTVLAVRDRRRPVELGVVLRHGKKSELLGPISGSRPLAPDPETPRVEVTLSVLHLGAELVELPLLVTPREHLVAPAGFVVVTAEDSQRLWVVEAR